MCNLWTDGGCPESTAVQRHTQAAVQRWASFSFPPSRLFPPYNCIFNLIIITKAYSIKIIANQETNIFPLKNTLRRYEYNMSSTLLTNFQCTTLNGFVTCLPDLGPRPKPHHFQDQEGITNRVKPPLGQLWRSVCWWQSQEPLEQSRGHSNGELTTNDLHRDTLRAGGRVINNYTGTAGVLTGSSQGNWDVALYAWAFFLVSTGAYTLAFPSIPSPQSLFSQTLAYSPHTSLLIRV